MPTDRDQTAGGGNQTSEPRAVEPDPFGYEQQPSPRAFVQWKGTDVCMDFHCDCGAHCHFDGYFAYVVECPHCHSQWQMPFNLYPRKFDPKSWEGSPPVILEPDEDLEEMNDDQ